MLAYVTFFASRTARAGGAVLLDCGAIPRQGIARAVFVFYFLYALFGIYLQAKYLDYGSIASSLFSSLNVLPLIIVILYIGLGHFLIRERGICSLWSIVRWEQIKFYGWEGSKLFYAIERKKFVGKVATLEFHPQCKDAVDAILREHQVPEAG